MFRTSKGDIGFLAFLLFLILVIFIITIPVKADEVKIQEPPLVAPYYTITMTPDEANLLIEVFEKAEIAHARWLPLYNSISHQVGVQNDNVRRNHDNWVNEENKRNAPKK